MELSKNDKFKKLVMSLGIYLNLKVSLMEFLLPLSESMLVEIEVAIILSESMFDDM